MDNTAVNKVTVTKIKKENINDEIKEFAETTMNELLGWYGYNGTTRGDAKYSRRSQHSESSESDSPKHTEGCGWCGKHVEESNGVVSASAIFCSELCFSHSRRANFKKNKTCDWCRHVRNTVTSIESQDGASQLQFCSEKCLNQYKMHIFCRETQAHLEMHPHVHSEESASEALITPDLWLKTCKSPNGEVESVNGDSAKRPESRSHNSPLPLITVAHPSKLLKPHLNINNDNKRSKAVLRKNKRKRLLSSDSFPCFNNINNNFCNNSGLSNDSPQDLRIRHTPDLDISALSNDVTKPETYVPLPVFSNIPSFPKEGTFPTNPVFNGNLPLERKPLQSMLPPPTVLVPYPIILPLPIPVPIPIPFPSHLLSLDKNKKHVTEEKYSQTEEVFEDSSPKKNGDINHFSVRPLRKRKRIFEQKPKIVIKTKKNVLS